MVKKVALVTGANKGIGFATAKKLLKNGHRVILTARDESRGLKAKEELQEYGDVIFHVLDVTDPASVEAIKSFVEDVFGRLDILINNAGINYDSWHSAENAYLAEVEETLDTNLMGPWRMAQAFVPMMKRQRYGRIVNVSSGAGALNGMVTGAPGYSISKAALNVLTIKLAMELGTNNILVNSVCPGWVKTDMGGEHAPRTTEKGAETIVWAAELPNDGPTRKFFRDMREIPW